MWLCCGSCLQLRTIVFYLHYFGYLIFFLRFSLLQALFVAGLFHMVDDLPCQNIAVWIKWVKLSLLLLWSFYIHFYFLHFFYSGQFYFMSVSLPLFLSVALLSLFHTRTVYISFHLFIFPSHTLSVSVSLRFSSCPSSSPSYFFPSLCLSLILTFNLPHSPLLIFISFSFQEN